MTAPYEDLNLTFEPSKLDPCENLVIEIAPPTLNGSLHSQYGYPYIHFIGLEKF